MVTYEDPGIFESKEYEIIDPGLEDLKKRIEISTDESKRMFAAMEKDLRKLDKEVRIVQEEGNPEEIEVAKRTIGEILKSWEDFIVIMEKDTIVEMKGAIGRMRETYLGE